MHEITKTIEEVKRIMAAGKRGVLVTTIATRGSTYRRAGARAVISKDDEAFGLISGGCVERDLAERIEKWLEAGRPQLFKYDTAQTTDILFGMGLGCRGVIDMLIEPFGPEHPPQLVEHFQWKGRQEVLFTTLFEGRELLVEAVRPQRAVAVFGGGSDVQPVIALAGQAGWSATAFSPRTLPPEEVSQKVDLKNFDAAVVMTHNFLHDLALLEVLLPAAIPYVGLLGPKSRGEELLSQLGDVGRTFGSRLHSPIGLDLGGETPEEIALSIVAEMQAVLNERTGISLRERKAAIHEPGKLTWA